MKNGSVKKNFLYQMIYQLLILLLPFITSPYIARVIGVEGLGIYSYSYTVASYFILIADLGIKNYGNRVIAQVRDNQIELNKTFINVYTVHVVVALVVSSVYITYALSLSEGRIIALTQIAFVISSLFDISWFYFGIERFKLTVTINSIIKIITVILVFVFIKSESDLWIYSAIMATGILLSQLFMWLPLKKYVSFTMPQWSQMKRHIKPLFVLFIPAIAVSLYRYMDKIMIGLLSDKIQLGYFVNAEKMVNMPITIIVSFGIVMLPKMSNLVANSKGEEAAKYLQISIQYVMMLAFALSFGLAGVGTVFAPVFWGEVFRFSGFLIIGLAITIPFVSFANVIRTQYLIPRSMDKEYLISIVVGAAINLVINITLIPHYGAAGATIGTIVAEMTVCLIQAFFVRKALPLFHFIKSFSAFFVIGLVMFAGVYLMGRILETSILTLVLQVIVGGLFYFLLSILYLNRTKDEVYLRLITSIKQKVKKMSRLV